MRNMNIMVTRMTQAAAVLSFLCIAFVSAEKNSCLAPQSCLVCKDPNVKLAMNVCTACCSAGPSNACNSSCAQCFESRNSSMPGDVDGSSSACELLARCSSDTCISNALPQPATAPQCDLFKDGKSCCPGINDDLKVAFDGMQGFLSGVFDKCAACGEAWERVFCSASCAPNQATFVRTERLGNGGMGYVLNMHTDLAVSIWRSCQNDDSAPDPEEKILFNILISDKDEKQAAEIFVESKHIKLTVPGMVGSTFEINVMDEASISMKSADLGLYDGHNYAIYEFCTQKSDTLVSMASYTIFRVGLLLVGAWVGNYLHYNHILWLPESGVFIILGMLYGVGCLVVLGPTASQNLNFDPDMLTLVLLPPIIFYSGFSMEHGNFGANLSEITIFAFFGTFISTSVVGCTLFSLSGMGGDYPVINIWESMAFAALISAVDPVATLATFSALRVDPNVEVLVFGESLLNDAVSIVLYKSFAKFTRYGGITSHFTVEDAIGKFISLVFGSIAIGFGVGCIHAWVFKFTFFKHTAVLEIIVFITLAYSSFLMAEMFHFSGIVASLLHGTMAAVFVKPNMSYEGHTRANILTNTLASLADMMIFLSTGLVTVINFKGISWSFTFVTLGIILVARAISTFPLVGLVNLCRSKERKIPMGHATVMWWSGLRGAIAIGLCAGVPTHLRAMMMSTTVIIVLFTVFVLGGGTPAVLKAAKIGMGKTRPEAHGTLNKTMRRFHISMAKILCNYDEDNDGVDDRYETEEYLRDMIDGEHVPATSKKMIKNPKIHPMHYTQDMQKSVKNWDVFGEDPVNTADEKSAEKNNASETTAGESKSRLKRESSESFLKILKTEITDEKILENFLDLLKKYKKGKVNGVKAREQATKLLKDFPKSLALVNEIFH